MQIKLAVMSLISTVVLSACSVVGIRSGTEEPRYTVLQVQGPLEIRRYGSRLAAETEVTGSEYSSRSQGFRRIARYIFGANSTKDGIAMTAPVAQAGGSHKIAMATLVEQAQSVPGVWRICFFMPAHYTEATLPRPDDPAVKIITVPGEIYGVYRYTGSINTTATEAADRELLHRLEGSGWVPNGHLVAWFYDPPWTLPFLRRNETAVTVVRPFG